MGDSEGAALPDLRLPPRAFHIISVCCINYFRDMRIMFFKFLQDDDNESIENEFITSAIEAKSKLLPHRVSICKSHTKLISCHVYRTPETLIDVILKLQKECGILIPDSPEDWLNCSRTYIDIRRDKVLEDGIREAKKKRFDPSKLLNVSPLYSTMFIGMR